MRSLDWAAGLFEGEGTSGAYSTTTRQETKRPRVAISMTDEQPVREFSELMGVGSVYGPKPNGAGNKPKWIWQTTNLMDFHTVARALHPLLSPRRQIQLETALAIWAQTQTADARKGGNWKRRGKVSKARGE